MERIDLKRFEKITEGKWEIRHEGKRIDIVVYLDDKDKAFNPVVNITYEFGDIIDLYERDVADMNAIAAVPEFLQALKEAYEEIDKLQKALSALNSTHFPK